MSLVLVLNCRGGNRLCYLWKHCFILCWSSLRRHKHSNSGWHSFITCSCVLLSAVQNFNFRLRDYCSVKSLLNWSHTNRLCILCCFQNFGYNFILICCTWPSRCSDWCPFNYWLFPNLNSQHVLSYIQLVAVSFHVAIHWHCSEHQFIWNSKRRLQQRDEWNSCHLIRF